MTRIYVLSHAVVEFTLLRDIRLAKSKIRNHNVRKAKFQLFKELANKTPLDSVLKDKEAEYSWKIFKEALLRAEKLSISKYRESGKKGKR